MIDQANDLRKLVMQAAENRPDGLPERVPMLLVSGGKGGVGTTTVAVNVAVAAAQRGLRAVLIDADPDRADVQSLCRLRDRYTVSDVLSGRRTLGEALQPGPAGVFVLPGAWAVADLADASESSQVRLLDQFAALGPRADVVVIDGGNGLHPFTRRLWRSCAEVVLVATPEPSAVLDAYAAIKVAASPRAGRRSDCWSTCARPPRSPTTSTAGSPNRAGVSWVSNCRPATGSRSSRAFPRRAGKRRRS